MLTLADIIARIGRLDELARGMAREVQVWKESGDPLLFAERTAYLKAIQDALAAIEDARTILAQVRQRIDALREETNRQLARARHKGQ